jgi:hypothetical protein
MAHDKTGKHGKAAPSKRPTTIDLRATEIKAAPAAETTKPEPEPAAEPEAVSGGSVPPPEPQDFAQTRSAKVPDNLPWALIAAGVAGALLFFAIGIGAGHWLSRDLSPVAVAPAPAPAVAGELLDRVGKLEAALAAQRAPDPQLMARIAAAEASVKTAADIAAARERRSDEIAVIARERASSAATTADEAAQKARLVAPEQSRAEVEAVISRLAAIEAVSRANQAEIAKRAATSVDDARSRFAISALSLRNAVESGAPFGTELTTVRALGGDAKSIAALEPFAQSGVPTAASLGRELSAAMPSIWKAARANEPGEGSFLERLQTNAERIVRIRPAGESIGDDAPSVKSRIELRAGNADIRGALTELAKLPPDARAPALDWIKKAEARNAAIAAAQSLAQTALSALAKPGS